MIYSPEHNFIFIKNYKVASTSIEVELSQVLSDKATVTPIKPLNRLLEPRNYLRQGQEQVDLLPHVPIEEFATIKNLDLKNITSVVFVRNPYNIVLSHLFMIMAFNHIDKDYTKYVDRYFNDLYSDEWLRSTKNIYCNTNNDVLATHIFKYEDGLEDQLNPVLASVGIKPIQIQAKEKAFRPKHITYNEVFSPKHIDLINNEWHWEFEKFGYKMEAK